MSQPVRFLLLSNNVKEQLQKHTLKIIEAWSSRWDLFKDCSWCIDISPSLKEVSIECEKILELKKNNQIFFAMGCPDSKHVLAGDMAKKKIASVNNSKLINYIIDNALSELQMDYVSGMTLVNEGIFKADKCAVSDESIQENNMAVVNVSTGSFHMILLLSAQLVSDLVDEVVVDHDQPPLEPEEPVTSFSDELIQLKIEYGCVDISVEELTTIRAGDVICLDKPISSSMSVNDKYGNHLFSGYLGSKEEQLVLKVAEKS